MIDKSKENRHNITKCIHAFENKCYKKIVCAS